MLLVQRSDGAGSSRRSAGTAQCVELGTTTAIWDRFLQATPEIRDKVNGMIETIAPLIQLLFFPGGLFLIVNGLVYEWGHRKLVARFQNRIGPRWFQPIADTLKLLAKEQIIPTGVNKVLFIGLPIIGVAGALTAGLYVPLMGLPAGYSFPGDLIVALYLLSLLTLCTGLAGWNTKSRFSLVGATRTLTQLFCIRSTLFNGSAWSCAYLGKLAN